MPTTITAATPIHIATGEHHSITRAAQILAGDIERITGQSPSIETGSLHSASVSRILILSADNPEAQLYLTDHNVDITVIIGNWEAYLHAVVEDDVIICGADAMGTLRGVYAFCRNQLGVDPLIDDLLYALENERLPAEETERLDAVFYLKAPSKWK